MIKSFIIAFSTYSKIPMPVIKWEEKNMKYTMCYFPLVGLVIGALLILVNRACNILQMNSLVQGAFYTAIPILVTGGIHMDGFMDTVDAKSSYGTYERRLEILKDPHAGAFAIIYGCLYLMISVALFTSLDWYEIVFVSAGYVYSRILSGLSVVCFRKAKKTGMLSDTAQHSSHKVKWILILELLVFLCFLFGGTGYVDRVLHISLWRYAIGLSVAGLLAFLYYGYTAKRWFGGITGDLAGYFLQICELWILIGITILKAVPAL